MYADGTESLFRVVEDGLIPTLVCLLLYVCMHKYNFEMKKHPSLAFLTRALNMVSINFILRSLASQCRESASLPVQTALYTVVLFLVDTVCAHAFTFAVVCPLRRLSAAPSDTYQTREQVSHVSSIFEESRDYAMWKVSQQLFKMYLVLDIDIVLSLAGSIVVLATRDLWSDNTALVFQLVVLVFVSVVLDAASKFLQASASVDKSVLLFVYVIVIHRLSSHLL